MKRNLIIDIFIIIVFLGGLILWHKFSTSEITEKSTLISSVQYICDNEKNIIASYYEGPRMPTPVPGEMPTPTGSVEISLNGDARIMLRQTISGSGIRYANEDESLVFWSKGDGALIMRNNVMDLSYINCIAKY